MPGPSLAAREEDDVHRRDSNGTWQTGPSRPCSMCFKGLHLAGNPVVIAPSRLLTQSSEPSRRETMPKRPRRDKQTVRTGAAPRTVRDLISARLPTLVESALAAAGPSEWQVAVLKALGPELSNKVNRCSLDSGKITVIAESSAWAA